MSGILLDAGQEHILNVLFKNTAVQNYYLALMTNTINPDIDAQIGDGITEVAGIGYARILITRNTDWTLAGQIGTVAEKIFTVGTGGWSNCNGYMVCTASTGNNAIWAQAFEPTKQGDYDYGDEIAVEIQYEQKDDSE